MVWLTWMTSPEVATTNPLCRGAQLAAEGTMTYSGAQRCLERF
jgi:hypothetical protein